MNFCNNLRMYIANPLKSDDIVETKRLISRNGDLASYAKGVAGKLAYNLAIVSSGQQLPDPILEWLNAKINQSLYGKVDDATVIAQFDKDFKKAYDFASVEASLTKVWEYAEHASPKEPWKNRAFLHAFEEVCQNLDQQNPRFPNDPDAARFITNKLNKLDAWLGIHGYGLSKNGQYTNVKDGADNHKLGKKNLEVRLKISQLDVMDSQENPVVRTETYPPLYATRIEPAPNNTLGFYKMGPDGRIVPSITAGIPTCVHTCNAVYFDKIGNVGRQSQAGLTITAPTAQSNFSVGSPQAKLGLSFGFST